MGSYCVYFLWFCICLKVFIRKNFKCDSVKHTLRYISNLALHFQLQFLKLFSMDWKNSTIIDREWWVRIGTGKQSMIIFNFCGIFYYKKDPKIWQCWCLLILVVELLDFYYSLWNFCIWKVQINILSPYCFLNYYKKCKLYRYIPKK